MEIRTSVSLRKEILDWINKQIKKGRFSSKSEVIESYIEKAKYSEAINPWLLVIILLLILNLAFIWLLH